VKHGWIQAALRRKTVAELVSSSDAAPLTRTLDRTDLIVLGVGAVIGAGIFVLPGLVAANYAGPGVVLSFLIAGAACALPALCYAEFSSLAPISGSAYTYAYITLGELIAWIIGWALILEYALGSALVALGLGEYMVHFVADVAGITPAAGAGRVAAIAAVAACTILLCTGIRRSASVTGVFVLIKVAVILLFVVFGAVFVTPGNWSPFIPPVSGDSFGWDGVMRGASILFVAFIGFDAVTTAAQEARNPQRDVPAGVLGSLAVSAVLYALFAIVLTGLVPYTRLGLGNPVAVALDGIGLGWLASSIQLGAIAALAGVLLVMIFGHTRIIFAMARDGLLPRALATAPSGTPVIATCVTGAGVIILTAVASLSSIAELVNVGTFFAFVLVCVGVPVLRRIAPELPRPFLVPGSPWLPLLGACACTYFMARLPARTWALAGIWFAAGMVLYVIRLMTASAAGRTG
jgi:basic amino acid/polyamine antiporter, APA family